METFTRNAGPDAPPVEADMCLTCGGVWLDGGEVALAYPGLAVLHDRRADVLAVGRPGKGISLCPRCQMEALEIPFFDVHLDVCPDCFGLWIDGDEIEALSRALDNGDGLPAPEGQVGGYRTSAASAMTKLYARCVGCDKEFPLRATVATPKGAMCEACAAEEPLPPLEEGDLDVPREPAVWTFLCDVGYALGAILKMGSRCPVCGALTTSRCSH